MCFNNFFDTRTASQKEIKRCTMTVDTQIRDIRKESLVATIIQRTIVGNNTEEIRFVGNADANYCISPYEAFLRGNLLQLNYCLLL